MKDQCAEPAGAVLQRISGMDVAGFDEYGFAWTERKIIGIHLKHNFAFQQQKEFSFLMPMRIQDRGSGWKLNPVSSERKHYITMYTVFLQQTLRGAVHNKPPFQ
ncbi:hypothetical protein D3C75_1014770 [compost metagenome]